MKSKMFSVLIALLAMSLVFTACTNPEADSNKTDPLFLYYDRETELYGYMNREGVSVIHPQYYYGMQFSEGLAFVETVDNINGYIDTTGELVITVEIIAESGFSNRRQVIGHNFSDGVAVVNDELLYYLINRQGEIISDIVFSIHGIEDGYTAYSLEAKGYDSFEETFSFFTLQGARATMNEYDYADNFSNGFAAVAMHGYTEDDMLSKYEDYKWGLINQDFELVIDYQYDDMGAYANGLIPVKLGEKWGYINADGKEVIPFRYNDIPNQIKANWHYRMMNFSYGNDYYGNLFRHKQQSGFHFSEGLAAVYVDRKGGYINTDGAWVISPQYQEMRPFSDGLAAVKDNWLWGFVDIQGNLVIPMEYKEVMNCVNGLIAVGDEDGYFSHYIDKTGAIVTPVREEE